MVTLRIPNIGCDHDEDDVEVAKDPKQRETEPGYLSKHLICKLIPRQPDNRGAWYIVLVWGE
jgi:hypothetical protein